MMRLGYRVISRDTSSTIKTITLGWLLLVLACKQIIRMSYPLPLQISTLWVTIRKSSLIELTFVSALGIIGHLLQSGTRVRLVSLTEKLPASP